MKEPDPHYEKRVLRDVMEQMRDPEQTGRRQETLRRAIVGAGSAGLVAAFVLALNHVTHPFLSALLAAAAGAVAGFGLFLEFAHKQWPVTRRHIDMESVRRRLEELES